MIKKISILLVLATIVYACSSSEDNPSNPNNPSNPDNPGSSSDKFDREVMLKHYANESIIPAFVDLNTKLTELKSKVETFNATPTVAVLNEVRSSWFEGYKAWQHVAKYDIGKAEELQFVSHFNIYPLNVTDVENNITSGTYDLNISNNHDAQGFPAIDYLIYGLGNDEDIIAKFSTDAKSAKYKKYLLDITTKMYNVNKAIVNDWKGGYTKDFVSSTGNTATSSLNKLVNDFIFYFEKRLRAYKIGVPAGNFSAKGKLFPEKVEAYYRKTASKELALEALNSFQDFFEGKSFSGVSGGESFKTYLVALKRADLATKISNQLDKARASINVLDNDFSKQINTDNTKMTQAYDELQKVVVLLKIDMLQAFNVSVDYVDADGD